jgi:hypothetical protein
MRAFDPVKLGTYEATVWVAYYRRQWGAFLRAAIGLVRTGFGMSWTRTLTGAWLVLRANQLWAPYPENDPEGARTAMRRFYELVVEAHGESFDVREAARLEVEWWRAHRYLQRDNPDAGLDKLVEALAALYAHVYTVPVGSVRSAAQHRAQAMRISDAWVAAGCDPASPDIAAERDELIQGYRILRKAVEQEQ